MRRTLVAAAPALLLAALSLLPFAHKAFNIDDPVFLWEAQHTLVDPLHPTAFNLTWYEAPQRLSSVMASGPVMAYLLVPAILAGGSEAVAHAIVGGLFLFAILATVALARRLGLDGRSACYAGLLLAATPAALAMAGSVMPDVPAMAFGVAGMERLYAWRDERRWHQALTAALWLALAALTRSHLILLLGVGALALLPEGALFDRRRWRTLPRTPWGPLIAVPLLSAGVLWLTHDPHAHGQGLLRSLLAQPGAYISIDSNLVAFATHFALALPLAAGWILHRRRQLPLRGLFIAVPVAVLLICTSGFARWSWIALPAALGAVVLVDVVRDGWVRRDQQQWVLASWLFIALPVLIYPHLPAKYLVASAPAVALLLARALAGRSLGLRLSLVATGLALGLAILNADAHFAAVGRRAATAVIAPAVARGQRVWFLGHWGFQWYAERAGARPFSTVARARPGDLLLTATESRPPGEKLLPARDFIGKLEDTTPGGRIMSRADCAGFYSNHWGFLPWSWGRGPIERFDLWRVR